MDLDVQAGEVLPTFQLRTLTLWVVPIWNTSNERHHISLSGPLTSLVLHWPPSYVHFYSFNRIKQSKFNLSISEL